ncbi:MAG: bacterio-opsin activator [Aquificaceae bacterium]|nr:bacterio-opsin activator [Aquificaceae bacterium]MDW8293867.1 bacterio-opsin activator [Aquificaceae bacterium]
MVIIAKPIERELEPLVMRVFLKSLDLLGGLSGLADYRTLTWLPSLARAVYCVVLREEYFKSEEEIAEKVGLTLQTVRNILRAEPTTVLEKLQKLEGFLEEERKELRVHTAGGIAKLAYKLVKEGQEEPNVFLKYCESVAYALDIPWAYMVLKRLRGTDFPIRSPENLLDRLEGVYIKGRTAKEVLQELEYPIKSPAELLHRLKENLKMHGLE